MNQLEQINHELNILRRDYLKLVNKIKMREKLIQSTTDQASLKKHHKKLKQLNDKANRIYLLGTAKNNELKRLKEVRTQLQSTLQTYNQELIQLMDLHGVNHEKVKLKVKQIQMIEDQLKHHKY